jgi:hypothetical protein
VEQLRRPVRPLRTTGIHRSAPRWLSTWLPHGHGEGAVLQRVRDGKWCAVTDLGSVNGKRRRKTRVAPTRADAVRALRRMQDEIDAGETEVDSRISVEKWCLRWLDGDVATGVRPLRSHRDHFHCNDKIFTPTSGSAPTVVAAWSVWQANPSITGGSHVQGPQTLPHRKRPGSLTAPGRPHRRCRTAPARSSTWVSSHLR